MSFIGWTTGLEDGIILVKNFRGFYLADYLLHSLKLGRFTLRCASQIRCSGNLVSEMIPI